MFDSVRFAQGSPPAGARRRPPPPPLSPTAAQGFFLLGIEEIGVQVEEPLGILALDFWCAVIAGRIDQLEGEHSAVQAAVKRMTKGGGETLLLPRAPVGGDDHAADGRLGARVSHLQALRN
jgi:hypothetical protein